MSGTGHAQGWVQEARHVALQLARHYPTDTDWQRVAADAGLAVERLRFDKSAFEFWGSIFFSADDADVVAIIDRALNDYPDDDVLQRARVSVRVLAVAASPEHLNAAAIAATQEWFVEPSAPLVDRADLVTSLGADVSGVADALEGRMVLLVGDSGVGKSRVAQRAASVAQDAGMLVLQAQCFGVHAEPLLPFRESLTQERVVQLLRDLVPDGADSTPFLRSLLDVDGAGGLSGPHRRGSGSGDVYEGLAKILLRLAVPRGLCLIVDDLTDADPDTLHFLDYLRRKTSREPMLVLATVRSDLLERPLRNTLNGWEADGCGFRDVPPLAPADAAELVAVLWTGQPLPGESIDRIVELTGGNPFFIEQVLKTLDDDQDGWLANVPPRVQALLRRRLDRTDEDTRAFVEAAAVALEVSHGVDLIAHVGGIDELAAAGGLRRACDAGFLAEDAQGGITFVQELLRRVVYDGIGTSARRIMHARAAEWLEGSDLPSSAAHHYEKAERIDDLVRMALAAAARAEHMGLFPTALQLYEQAQPYADESVFGVRMAKALIAVGRWTEADELLDRLPPEAFEVRILRSELSFVRGDFTRALEEMEWALQAPVGDRAETLIRLGEINLYLGELGTTAEHATEALRTADEKTAVARCRGLLGACAHFSGHIDEGERHFSEALAILSSQPEEVRDRTIYTIILGNLGQTNEARERWQPAKRFHTDALGLRRAVSDARGELQSLHALARSEIGVGSIDHARQLLDEARRLAAMLGARLEEGKIDHTAAQLALLDDEPVAAVRLAEAALQRFRHSCVAYDVAHARFTLTTALAAWGAHRRAVEEGARARCEAEGKGYGLLATLYPDLGVTFADRILAGLIAYACGDALGLPWEGRPPAEIDAARILALPATEQWSHGSTSDDTALTLLVCEHLVSTGEAGPEAFAQRLVESAPGIPGLGPSTTTAIDHIRSTGRLPTEGGNTNGALMRALPIGWAFSLDRFEERRAWTVELSRVTHTGPEAVCAACVGSACAAWALEGASPSLLLEVAAEEAAAVMVTCDADDRLLGMLTDLAAARWSPPPNGVSLDPYETLLSALWCLVGDRQLPDALIAAVRLGGDTDTVAALVGGLLGCTLRPGEVQDLLPFSADVDMSDRVVVRSLAQGLARLRCGRSGG
jgi:ADP-ribosylglycohydrolase